MIDISREGHKAVVMNGCGLLTHGKGRTQCPLPRPNSRPREGFAFPASSDSTFPRSVFSLGSLLLATPCSSQRSNYFLFTQSRKYLTSRGRRKMDILLARPSLTISSIQWKLCPSTTRRIGSCSLDKRPLQPLSIST